MVFKIQKLKETPDGVILSVKIIPKSSKNEIVGWEGDYLKIRINAVPKDGEANEALINFLAKFFGIAKSSIKLLSGQTSRLKKFHISQDVGLISASLEKHGLKGQ